MQIDIDRYFVDHPELRVHFYSYDQETPVHAEDDPHTVGSIASWLVEFYDYVLTQEANMPPDIADQWREVVLAAHERSPAIRKYWSENWAIHSPTIQAVLPTPSVPKKARR